MSNKKSAMQKVAEMDRTKDARKQRRRAAKLAGAMMGGFIGGPTGAKLGALAGGALARITGFGDYQVSANVLSNKAMVLRDDQTPAFNVKGGVTTITHREYIRDVVSTGSGFSVNTLAVNPGDKTVFPWLCEIARKYQKYRFKGLVFEFRTMSSEYASGSALGTVVLASNYNAGDVAYTSKVQMENSAFATSCKPSCSMLHPIECAPNLATQGWYYTRDGANTVTAVQFYDLCNTYLATQGISAPEDSVLGELWATYVVELTEPVISPDPTPVEVNDFAGKQWSFQLNQATMVGGASTMGYSPGVLPQLGSDLGLPTLNAQLIQIAGSTLDPTLSVWQAGAAPALYEGPNSRVMITTASYASTYSQSTVADLARLYFTKPGLYTLTIFEPRSASNASGWGLPTGANGLVVTTAGYNFVGGAVYIEHTVTAPVRPVGTEAPVLTFNVNSGSPSMSFPSANNTYYTVMITCLKQFY